MKNWRASIRQVVNRDDNLSLWRRAVIRVVDPAESYVRRREDRPARERRQAHSGWVSYERVGIPVVKAPKPRTAPGHTDRLAAPRDRLARLLLEFGSYFDDKAHAVMAGSPTKVATTGGTITSRLVKFRHGASVLEWETVSANRRGHGSMRLDERVDPRHAIVERLALLVLEFGSDAQPTPD